MDPASETKHKLASSVLQTNCERVQHSLYETLSRCNQCTLFANHEVTMTCGVSKDTTGQTEYQKPCINSLAIVRIQFYYSCSILLWLSDQEQNKQIPLGTTSFYFTVSLNKGQLYLIAISGYEVGPGLTLFSIYHQDSVYRGLFPLLKSHLPLNFHF